MFGIFNLALQKHPSQNIFHTKNMIRSRGTTQSYISANDCKSGQGLLTPKADGRAWGSYALTYYIFCTPKQKIHSIFIFLLKFWSNSKYIRRFSLSVLRPPQCQIGRGPSQPRRPSPYNVYGDAMWGEHRSSGVGGRSRARCYRGTLTTPRGVRPLRTSGGH